jgi:hypothetical protein
VIPAASSANGSARPLPGLELFRCPVVRLETIGDTLGLNEDEVLALLESGKFEWAFNIASKGATRREIRVLTVCLCHQVEAFPCPFHSIDQAIASVIPLPVNARPDCYALPASLFRRRLACSQDLINSHIKAGELQVLPVRRAPKESPRVRHASAVRFLRERAL